MRLFHRASTQDVALEPQVAVGGFAVVDVETTGLYPTKDRILEVGIVHVSPDGVTTGRLTTLVNPQRAVCATHVHGITATDVASAPTFAEAAPTLWRALAGRVVVAHNAPFDLRFLHEEFARCDLRMPQPVVMCTMRLALEFLPGLTGRSLPACCAAAGVRLSDHHSALADAEAAAGLLATFRSAQRQLPAAWRQALDEAAGRSWTPMPPVNGFRPVAREEMRSRHAVEPAPLARVLDQLPRAAAGEPQLDAYLGVLDRVLEDRLVTDAEVEQLLGVAADLGLDRGQAERAHRDYLQAVAVAAWEDGVVTPSERADMYQVARLLGVPTEDADKFFETGRLAQPATIPQGPEGLTLHVGDRIAFTGATETPREELKAMALAAGLRVTSSVGHLTSVVVIADALSQSAKARAARQHAVPMIVEQVFLRLLTHVQPELQQAKTAPKQRSSHQRRQAAPVLASVDGPRRVMLVGLGDDEERAVRATLAREGAVVAAYVKASLAAVVTGPGTDRDERVTRAAALGVPVRTVNDFLGQPFPTTPSDQMAQGAPGASTSA